ncbi:hypothetical protein ACFQWF_04240 [Methylorubrum suomiense]
MSAGPRSVPSFHGMSSKRRLRPAKASSMIGLAWDQASAQTTSKRSPMAQGSRGPSSGKYVSLKKKVRSGPQARIIDSGEFSTRLSAVRSSVGQVSGRPRGWSDQSRARITRAASPPPARKAKLSLTD